MNPRKLDRGELIAALGGVVLGLSLFLTWYSLGNRFTSLSSCHGPGGSCSGWASLGGFRYALLLAAVAPVILDYIIVRGHALSWPRGELTAVVALAALTLIVFRGVIDKPGSPPAEITVSVGWWLAMLGGVMILLGAIWRTRESSTRRKPPGVL